MANQKLFSDDEGNFSFTRVSSFVSLIAAGVLLVVKAICGGENIDSNHISILLAGAFGAKTIQKFAEKRGAKN